MYKFAMNCSLVQNYPVPLASVSPHITQFYDTAHGLEDRQPPDEVSAPTSRRNSYTQHATIHTWGDGRSVFPFAAATCHAQ